MIILFILLFFCCSAEDDGLSFILFDLQVLFLLSAEEDGKGFYFISFFYSHKHFGRTFENVRRLARVLVD
jgi:hypothetical protein